MRLGRRARAGTLLAVLGLSAALAATSAAPWFGAHGPAAWLLPAVHAAQITYVNNVVITNPADGASLDLASADVGDDDVYPLAVTVDTQTETGEGPAGASTRMEYYLTPQGQTEPVTPTAISQTPPYSANVSLPLSSRSQQFTLRAAAVTGSTFRAEDTVAFTVNRLLSSVDILAPVPDGTIVVSPGTTSYALTLRAQTDFPSDTAAVRYYLIGSGSAEDTLLAEATNPVNDFEAQYDLPLPVGSEEFTIQFRLRAEAETKSTPTITASRGIVFTISTQEPAPPPSTRLAVTSPRSGEAFAAPASTDLVHVGFSVRPERAEDVLQVDYYVDDAPPEDEEAKAERLAAVSTAGPAFGAGAWAATTAEENTVKLRAVATNILQFEQAQGEATFTVRKEAFQPEAAGPDQIPLDVVLGGETWYNISPPPSGALERPQTGVRQTLAAPLYPVQDGSSTRHALADPYAPARAAVVEIPSAVLHEGETGVLLFSVADTLEALLGSADPVADGQARGPLAEAGLYAQVCVVVTANAGATYYELPAERLSVAPITLYFSGLENTDGRGVSLAKADSEPVTLVIAERPALSFDILSNPVAWVRGTDTATVAPGALTANVSSISAVFAPVESGGSLPMCGAGGKFSYAAALLVLSASAVRRRRRK